MAYNFYAFFFLIGEDSDASLDIFKKRLEEFYKNDQRGVDVVLNDNLLTLRIYDWRLYIRHNTGEQVKTESLEMADSFAFEKPQKNLIAESATRFEMSADPDPGMNYFNDTLIVQQKIENFKNIFVFDCNNSTFANI